MQGYKETAKRQEAMRENPELEPIRCPSCGFMRLSGPTCPQCGHTSHKRSRMVVQVDGTLKLAEGPLFKPHVAKNLPEDQKKWNRYFWGARKAGRTFRQAIAYMYQKEHVWPSESLKFMPIDPSDAFEKIINVPFERLRT